jgi:transposase
MSGRRKHTKEFKLDAVKLVVERGRAVRDVARSLGVNETLIHSWKRKFLESGELAFPGNGNRQPGSDLEEENRRLRKELADAKKDNEILKKAAAYFAKHQS